MSLGDYTTTQEVRSALGVDESELDDDTLALPMYETELGISLGLVSDDLQTDYLLIAAMPAGTRSALEEKVYGLVRLFSTYTVAAVALTSLPLRALKGESDEKADYTRMSGDLTTQVATRIASALERATLALVKAYGLFNATPVVSTVGAIMGVISPSYDPVTG